MSGSEGGPGKRTGGNAGAAPGSTLPGRGQMRVPQLALDQRQRDPLMQQLDSVRMAELVGREAPPDVRLKRDLV